MIHLRLGVLAHLVGGQDLSADRLGHNLGRGVHRLPEQIAIVLGDLAGVDADADLDGVLRVGGVVLVQRALDGGGGTDRCHGGREGDEEPVAQGLAHPATERHDLVAHDRCLQPKNVVGVLVAARPPQRGRADDVGHHDREHRWLRGYDPTTAASHFAAQHLTCPVQTTAARIATLQQVGVDQESKRRSVSGSGPSKYCSMTCLNTS